MSETRINEYGNPIENVENSVEEINQLVIPNSFNNMNSRQEFSSTEISSDKIDNQIEQLDNTIINKIPENESISIGDPIGDPVINDIPNYKAMESVSSFFNREESEHFKKLWVEIQGKFVDEPRKAVQQADELLSEMIEQIMQMFDNELGILETQWNQGDIVSTEDLRQILQHYRSFFNRLVVWT
jgi:hypothetical protein